MKNKRVDNDGGKTGRSYATTSLVRAEHMGKRNETCEYSK